MMVVVAIDWACKQVGELNGSRASGREALRGWV